MKYRDTENGKIWDGIDLLAEYIENSAEIEESSGARNFSEWLRNATSNNGFLQKLSATLDEAALLELAKMEPNTLEESRALFV